MQEAPLADQTEALDHADDLVAGHFEVLVLLTGVGFEMLCDVLALRHPREAFAKVLRERTLLCRGPKPVAVLKRMGLSATLVAPEPNTWRDLLAEIDGEELSLVGKRVVVQEYGVRNQALLDALGSRGGRVLPVPVYAWRLPDDIEPLARAAAALCDGDADGLLVTSQQQLRHLFQVAEGAGCLDALKTALRTRALVASVGPITSEALAEHGIGVDVEPEHPKMGHLVRALAAGGAAKLSDKRDRAKSS